MLSSVTVVRGADFTVRTVICAEEARGHWSEPESRESYGVVLVRSGMFGLRCRDGVLDADAGLGYVETPESEHRFVHHDHDGDVCTAIDVSAELWHTMASGASSVAVPVDGRLDLAHRLLLRSAHDPAFAAAESLLDVLATAAQAAPPTRPATALVGRAREAIATDHPGSRALMSLARLLGVSPYHLSRVFRQETGATLTRYRNRARVRRALARIEEGERDLGLLAADLGFADQAHLGRTVKAEVGHSPSRLRRLLGD